MAIHPPKKDGVKMAIHPQVTTIQASFSLPITIQQVSYYYLKKKCSNDFDSFNTTYLKEKGLDLAI